MPHPIELEIRAELAPGDIARVRAALEEAGFEACGHTRRTMLMSFGQVGRIAEDDDTEMGFQETDIRCRITNGEAEIVVKLGDIHSHNRQEVTTPITPENLGAFARVVGTLNMFHKVGSRTTENFARGNIVASIISSRSGLAYLELEKMSDDMHAEVDRSELTELAHELRVTPWPGREAFMHFCTQLTQRDDWRFYGTEAEVERFLKEAFSF